MKKKNIFENKIVNGIMIFIVIALAILAIIKIKSYIGYSTAISSEAGSVTTMLIDQRQCTEVWGGFYGMAVLVIDYNSSNNGFPTACLAEQKHLLFPCINTEGDEVYASTKHPDYIEWESVVAATVEEIDQYLNKSPGDRDSANNTFTTNITITLGTRSITAPGTYTKQYGVDNSQTYNLVALKDNSDGTLIFATSTANSNSRAFNNEQANYQIMLPMPNNTNPRYYFTTDPYETCPEGWGQDIVGEGIVYGYTYNNVTKKVVDGVSIYVGSTKTTSGSDGFYNMTTQYGYQYIVAIKEGYETYVGLVNISIGVSTFYNISLIPEDPTLLNGTVHGFVTDNGTNLPIANSTVTARGQSAITDENGEYNLTILEGTHNIVAIKTGYENYIKEINVTGNATLEHNISMITTVDLENKTIISNSSITGYVLDNSTLDPINNATISVAGKLAYSNESGYYIISVREGTHNIIAFKTGYDTYINNVTVKEGNITYHNITIGEVEPPGEGSGQGPGAGAGQGAGQGAGLGAGQGAGRGPGTGIPRIEQPVEIVEHEVSIKKIIRKLREGNFIKVPITIFNHKEESVNIRMYIEGDVKEMARLDKDSMLIEATSSDEVTLTLLGNVEPGIYEGNFVVTGDIEEKIPIYVLVLEKERLDVEALVIKVIPEKRKIAAGSIFKYRVDLQNLLSEEKYKVDLSYTIKGINNNRSIFIEKEDIVILTSFSLLKFVDLPSNLEPGDYQLNIRADFLGLSAEQATIFTVVEPFYKYALFGVLPVWVLFIIISILSLGTFGTVYYKKKKAEKQRYKIEVDYNQLPKPGPRSAYVGMIAETNKKTYFDLEQLTIHTLVAGSTGGGKTVAAQGIIEEALLKGTSVIVFDPTVQWTGFLRRCQDKRFLELYPKFGFKKSDARAFDGNIHQIENAREVIEFKKYMKPGEINVFVVNKLDVKDYEIFVSNVIRGIFHENLPEARQLKLMIIFDEFHRLLPKYGGTGEVMIQVERATREFRKWGVGMMLISQVISDFKAEVLANINTQIQMRTKDEGDLNRIKEEYGENLLKSLVKAAVGAGMVENAAYNKGKPYFIQFRPLLHSTVRLSDEELENYNKYNKVIDDLDYQLEQLEKEEIDVFDLRLELKLAQDKVKSGSFNMVDIYLDGLKPRVKAQWDKIGKQPKKREIKLISEDELKKEIAKAKKAKESETSKEDHDEEKKETQQEKKEESHEKNQEKNNEEIEEIKEDKGYNLEELFNKIDEAIGAKDKGKVTEYYSRLQSLYKKASKEDKKIIFEAINIIKEKWNKK